MSTEKAFTEEEKLYKDGLQLIANGHGMTYVFKYVRDRAESDEVRKRIMEKLTTNNQVKQVNKARLDHVTKSKDISWTEMIIGISVVAFALFLTKALWSMGWVSTLPLFLIGFVLYQWTNRR